LRDIRVLDLSQNLAGPYCAQALADLGAEVIKIEPPAGDPARAWGPPFEKGESTIFLAANRNKRSVVLDLKSEHGAATLWQLIAAADVLIQSFRAGVVERLGFGSAAVRARHPRLVYCSVTAYGASGPLRELPGYDPLMQAHGGLISVTGQPDAPARVGTSIIDMGTGLWATIAVLAALRERDRSGVGTDIVTSLFDTALAWNAYHLMGWFADGNVPRPHGTAFSLIAPYGAFPCTDGQLMIAAGNDGLFRRLCAALQLDGVADDARFASNAERVAHRAAIDALVAGATRRFSVAALLDLLRAAGVPCAPVLDVAAVATDPQTVATGMIAQAPGVDAGPTVLAPYLLDGERPPVRRAPPTAGQHTAEVLGELAGGSEREPAG
jgi:crotonobetainyl-CoA:carnitine CoA-transferase CaiB-like acyl-CoA transferase